MRRAVLACAVILFAPIAFLAGESPERPLTFERRVAAQTAIETLYYKYRLEPTKSLAEAIPRNVVEDKVRTYLAQSTALDRYWHTPVTSAMLTRELERIARNTLYPDRLEEIFSALDNDAFLIQECFVRPIVVDRLARNFFAWDRRFHEEARQEASQIRDELLSGALDRFAEHPRRLVTEVVDEASGVTRAQAPGRFALPHDELERLRRETANEIGPVTEQRDAFVVRALLHDGPRALQVAQYVVPKLSWDRWWSESAADLEGPVSPAAARSARLPRPAAPSPNAATGGTCPGGDAWINGSLAGDTPGERTDHTSVWTGSEMIVWGGRRLGAIGESDGGGRYDPLTDTWTPIATLDAPEILALHTAVWTGTEMIVWGGTDGFEPVNTGGRYDPLSDTWSPMSTSGAPAARSRHTAVWTGSEMVVWGGLIGPFPGTTTASGGRYDPEEDTWAPTTDVGAPSPRVDHVAVWTGGEMIVWGNASDGGRYDPVSDSWTATSTVGSPSSAFVVFSGVWTGNELLVWATEGSGRYDPSTDTWAPISTTGEPSTRFGQSAVWTGDEMILWSGGFMAGGDFDIEVKTGARYDPATDSWTPTTTLNAPRGRFRHTAVWTGELMIAWGGDLGITATGCCAAYENSGGRYDPDTDSWTRTSAHYGSRDHTAIWTGNQMIVWGGEIGSVPTDIGGRYDPVTDSWSATTTIGAPAPRRFHTAVWTGDEMIVWGGDSGAYHDTGGRYDPSTDSWSATTTIGAPAPRSFHTAVWTGDEMIVWGGDDPRSSQDYSPFSSGGRYDPAADTWMDTSLVDAPAGRLGHTAVWTGNRMVVWGGVDTPWPPNTPYATGGRYDPASDSWTATSSSGSPQGRYDHSAVWTGERMIVWGGRTDPETLLGSGSRYDALFDNWSPTLNTGVKRAGHTAVWTGDEMIVWGGDGSGAKGARYSPATNSWTLMSETDEPPADAGQTAVWTGELMLVWGTGDSDGGVGGRYLPAASTDGDADTWCSIEDCNDADGGIWSTPGEVTDLVFESAVTLSWTPPVDPGGVAVLYDAVRSGDATDFVSSPTCVADGVAETEAEASGVPDPDEVFFYLVRAVNSCPLGLGSLGGDSSKRPRAGVGCPRV